MWWITGEVRTPLAVCFEESIYIAIVNTPKSTHILVLICTDMYWCNLRSREDFETVGWPSTRSNEHITAAIFVSARVSFLLRLTCPRGRWMRWSLRIGRVGYLTAIFLNITIFAEEYSIASKTNLLFQCQANQRTSWIAGSQRESAWISSEKTLGGNIDQLFYYLILKRQCWGVWLSLTNHSFRFRGLRIIPKEPILLQVPAQGPNSVDMVALPRTYFGYPIVSEKKTLCLLRSPLVVHPL